MSRGFIRINWNDIARGDIARVNTLGDLITRVLEIDESKIQISSSKTWLLVMHSAGFENCTRKHGDQKAMLDLLTFVPRDQLILRKGSRKYHANPSPKKVEEEKKFMSYSDGEKFSEFSRDAERWDV